MVIFQSLKLFFRDRNVQEKPWNSTGRAIFVKFQAPKFEISERKKMQFHTPSHSIPPLDSLLEILCHRCRLSGSTQIGALENSRLFQQWLLCHLRDSCSRLTPRLIPLLRVWLTSCNGILSRGMLWPRFTSHAPAQPLIVNRRLQENLPTQPDAFTRN